VSTSSSPQVESARTGPTVTALDNAVRADVDRFIRVPRSPGIQALYAPYRGIWCPYTEDTLRQTLSPKNPIYEHTDCQLFVASRDGVDCGRVVAFHNPLSSLTAEQKLGFFGFFEAADQETARALLLDGAWPWLRKLGMAGLVGNISPTTNDEVGVLVEGFHRHILLLEFNPPEYPKFLEGLGFTKAKDVLSFTTPLREEVFAEVFSGKGSAHDLDRISAIGARRAGITLEYLNKRKVSDVAREFCTVYNRAWRHHWGFEPFTSAELLYLAKDLLMLLPSDLIVLARNKQGKMVGAALCTPDLNVLFREFDGKMGPIEMIRAVGAMWAPKWLPFNPRPNLLRIIALGVLPEYARRGAAAAIMAKLVVNGMKHGLAEASVSWVLEDNDEMLEVPRRFKLPIDQTWRLYQYRPGETS
jgi:hypothetical protein